MSGCVLSGHEIEQAIQESRICIDPYNSQNLNTNSYDLTLGFYYYRMNQPTLPFQQSNLTAEQIQHNQRKLFYNPFSRTGVEKSWNGFHKADDVKNMGSYGMTYTVGDNVDVQNDKAILLRPGESILAHTHEFFGTISPYSAMITPHKDLSLNFINMSAQWGNSNYIDRWTIHITNTGNYWIPLICGMRIATVTFFKGEDTMLTTADEPFDFDIDLIKKSWKPSNLLPRTFVPKNSQQQRRERRRKKSLQPQQPQLQQPQQSQQSQQPQQQQPQLTRAQLEAQRQKDQQTFRQQHIQYQQQIQREQKQHQQRIAQGRKRGSLRLPEPPRDVEGKPILPSILQPIATKESRGSYVAPEVLKYDPLNV